MEFRLDAQRVLQDGKTLQIMKIDDAITCKCDDQIYNMQIEYKERAGYGRDGELFEGFWFTDQFQYLDDFK